MARILLIETATEVCSAAIAVDGEVVAIAEELHVQSHAALLTLQIESCVKMCGIPLATLDAVAVSRGPGSYTALRVGASVAKGICYALGKPLIAVDTLLALAWASKNTPLSPGTAIPPTVRTTPFAVFIPMLDARRQEVWTAAYDDSLGVITPAQPIIIKDNLFQNFIYSAVRSAGAEVALLSGNGCQKTINETFNENVVIGHIKNCSAGYLSGLSEQFFQNADFQDVAYFEPFYMKPPNITTPSRAQF